VDSRAVLDAMKCTTLIFIEVVSFQHCNDPQQMSLVHQSPKAVPVCCLSHDSEILLLLQ
jgi:hypothetical protein